MLTRKILFEEFAKFAEDPSRDGFRELLINNVGELSYFDFKEQWPEFPKLARHILALANSGGGCIVAGVAEKEDKTLEPIGLEKLAEKTEIINGLSKFLPNSLIIGNNDILDFPFPASEYPTLVGKKFQLIFIQDDPEHLPFISTNNENKKIRKNAVYVRRGTSSEEANYEELQNIINRRLETGYSSQAEMDLRTHIEQLKALYEQIKKVHVRFAGGLATRARQAIEYINEGMAGKREDILNPAYPKESFDEFIARMIEKKKKKIEIELGVADLKS